MICPTCNFDNLPGCEVCYNCLHDLTQHDQPVAHDRVQQSLMGERVSALRPRAAITLGPDATVDEAMRTMLDNNIGALLIVDGAGLGFGGFARPGLVAEGG